MFSNAQDTPSVVTVGEEAGVYVFNLNSSMKEYAPTKYLGVVKTDWGPFFSASVEAHLNGNFEGRNEWLGVDAGVVVTEEWNSDISSEMVQRIKNAEAANQDVFHPVVITHPETGKKALYVNPTFTLGFEGWSDEESRPLLEYLYLHASKPEFTCRFQWKEGSIAFWDNRSTWHLAINDYHGERRLMHRITIEGVKLH